MSPVRGIPTSRAYWELKAEQVLNRVFEPEKPIELEVCDTASIPIALPNLELTPETPPPPRASRARSSKHQPTGTQHLEGWIEQLGRQPSLLLAGVSVTVMVVAAMPLVVLGVWNHSQQAIRQERNMLLIERLRSMGPGSTTAVGETVQAAAPKQVNRDGELPPPPPSEPWMEELTTLPASSAPQTDMLQVPAHSRITSPAPAVTGSTSSGGNAPQLVGVVQVPGHNGAAIFQIGGNSTSAAVGESIGSSGWRLRSASGDSAVIEKGSEQRRVSISSGF